jgi:L-iditol 2-dehydrogenase
MTETMLAVVIPEPNRFELSQVPIPTPGPAQVLLRVMASTMCGTDRKILAGQFPGTRFPHIPGHEFAGEIAAVGPGVDTWSVGNRVGVEIHVGCGRCPRCLEGLYNLCENYGRTDRGHAHLGFTVPGGLAQYCVVPVAALHRLPDHVSWEEGMFTDGLGVALWAFERAAPRGGEKVAVVGSGAFGALAVQFAWALGASQVALVGTRAERMALIDQLPYPTVLIDGSAENPVARVRELFYGRGADLVVEFAGSESGAREAIEMARRGGRVVLAGSTGPGRELRGLDLSTIVRGHLDILGSVANPRGVSGRALALLARGAIKVEPLVTHRFPLTAFAEAWDTFVERRGGALRVMVLPNGG